MSFPKKGFKDVLTVRPISHHQALYNRYHLVYLALSLKNYDLLFPLYEFARVLKDSIKGGLKK